jgi:hypothetical protein
MTSPTKAPPRRFTLRDSEEETKQDPVAPQTQVSESPRRFSLRDKPVEFPEQEEEQKEEPGMIGKFFDQKKEDLKGLGRAVSRGTEAVIGAPRNFGEFLEELVPEKALKAGAGLVGLEEPVTKAIDTVKKYSPYKLLPSSEDVRDVNKYLFGKTFEPENEDQKKVDEVVTDFVNLAIPLKGKELKVLKPALTSLGGNLVKEGLEYVGIGKEGQQYGKIGTFFLTSLIKPGAANSLKNELYNDARNARPERVRINTPNLTTGLNSLERRLKQGGSESWKSKIFDKVSEIRKQISGDSIEVQELEKFKNSTNNIISELYSEKNVGKTGIKSAQKYTNELAKTIDKSLEEYGKVNPKWEALYRPANEVHGAIESSKRARNFITRQYKKLSLPSLGVLFGVEQALGPLGVAGAAAAGGAGFLGAELVARMWKSPTIRKLYTNIVNGAVKKNSLVVNENMKKLDKEFQKEKKKSQSKQ